MDAILINSGLAFLEGFALIISPCILPILPLILSGSLTGGLRRPIGIIVGFVITFTIVTLFSRLIVNYMHISPDALRYTSYVILFLLGFMMLSTYLSEKFALLTAKLVGVGSSFQTSNPSQSGFISGLLFGALVGIIWTPCAGPILAAVIVQAIIQHTTLSSVLIVAAFAVGAGLPMLLIALMGREIMQKFDFFRKHAVLFRKLLGAIIIASVVVLFYMSNSTIALAQPSTTNAPVSQLANGLEHPYPAPEIGGIEAWINSPPLQLSQLKGKVVLIDFWTYSCINCIRTLPYLKEWYAKYHDKGLEIIGIHSPEFEFEHDLDNVKNAVKKDGILYPVALDNDFVTWQRFHNQYWPAHFLIDKNGNVVYEHFGEGEYDTTENNIRYLLGINSQFPLSTPTVQTYSTLLTPETYLGYARAENFSNALTMSRDKKANYTYPSQLSVDHWALNGNWSIYPDKIIAETAGSSIKLHFNAQEVYAVMGADRPIDVKVTFTNLSAPAAKTIQPSIRVLRNQLYTVVKLDKESEGIVELTASAAGLEMYTFTFGG